MARAKCQRSVAGDRVTCDGTSACCFVKEEKREKDGRDGEEREHGAVSPLLPLLRPAFESFEDARSGISFQFIAVADCVL